MDFFWNALSLIGGLALFLFGMSFMGQGLEQRAGGRLSGWLSKMTASRFRGLLLGTAVTALIQSSSAVTVMAVGFVNSGLLTLSQVTGVIFGANIGTTVTAWLVSLTQIEGGGLFFELLKPTSFTPILALIGIICYMFCKKDSLKSTGGILLGFAVLMYGMSAMSDAARPLAEHEGFRSVLLWFDNPLFGLLAGALLTAIIQSSSASVGILQALSATGQISVGATIPIIMGQNIGTCVTALLSCVGAGKNAKRTALIHLYFNLIGSGVLLVVYLLLQWLIGLPWSARGANAASIALTHTVFNLLCTLLLYPAAPLLVRLAERTIPDRGEEKNTESEQALPAALLDARFLALPALAIEHSRTVADEMAVLAVENIRVSFSLLSNYDGAAFERLVSREDRIDRMQDEIENYLVTVSGQPISEAESMTVTALLHQIGDWERIADHAVNIGETARTLSEAATFSDRAWQDLTVLRAALDEILALSLLAFREDRIDAAEAVEPLEEVIDDLRAEIRDRSVARLCRSECSVEVGFLFTDLLTDLERIADHCSNIAGVLLSASSGGLRVHDYLERSRGCNEARFEEQYRAYAARFALPRS
ncbi:MAG: Na/Pi cotransporter family protein [Ruminococcaceae bacterium]|nr:Na/Pi cotransporter family protein [Oscillospiraceae bacterium]